jgi:hypothetical protein
MTTALCVVCGRPTPDQAYACTAETARAAAQLAEIAELTGPARDVAHGQTSRGSNGGSGKPGSRLPLDLGATARLDAVEQTLATWARHISAERGVALP